MYALIIWTVITSIPYGATMRHEHDWRVLVQVAGEKNCHAAAQQLGLKPEKYRCVFVNP